MKQAILDNVMRSSVMPEEWQWFKLGDVCTLKTGGTPSKSVKEYWDGGTINWLLSGDVNKEIIYDVEHKITLEGLQNSNAKILPENSVLIALNGQGKTRGKVAILKTKSTCNQSIVALIPKNEKQLHFQFLFYYLKASYQKLRTLTGSNERSGLNMRILREFKIPIPSSLEEQSKLASRFQKQMTLVELIKQDVEAENEAAEQYYESLTKKLFSSYNCIKVKMEDICKINPKKPKLDVDDDFETVFVPMNSINQHNGTIDMMQMRPFRDVKRGYTYFEENDVLFAKITPCMQNKKSAVAKNLKEGFGFGSTEFHVLRATDKILPDLLLHIVRQADFICMAKANFTGVAGHQRVPKKFMEDFEVRFPPSKEDQVDLLKKINKANNEIQIILSSTRKSLESLSMLPLSILNEVFK